MASSIPVRYRPWPPHRRTAGLALATALAALTALLAGCTSGQPPAPGGQNFTGPRYTLRTLASNELTDMRPILRQAAQATGVTVVLTPTTTLAGTRAVASAQADGPYDATWFATNRYLTMWPGGLNRLDGASETMSSPVIIGVRASVARRLGWDSKPVSWSDIAAAVAAHQFSFGMSNPANSNSGLSALVGVATAIAGDGAALQPAEVTRASPRLREFFSGQSLMAPSSSALADDYVRAQDADRRGAAVDGIIDYESVLLSLNASGKLRQPLKLIYPSDGVITADYTLSLLASAPPAAKSAYDRLVGYLLTPRVQRQIMRQTRRRPAIPGVRLDAGFGQRQMFEVPFPGTLGVINDLIRAYDGTLRRPVRTIYVLDIDQSMAGARLAGLKTVLGRLTGEPASHGGTLPDSEQITIEPFSSAPYPAETIDIPARHPQPALSLIRAVTASLAAGGSTAIYDALAAAYQNIARQDADSAGHITTIVLLTGGMSTTGRGLAAFTRFYHHLPPAVASVPVFPVVFGPAGTAQMQQLASLTGGQVFNAHRLPLITILRLISEDQ